MYRCNCNPNELVVNLGRSGLHIGREDNCMVSDVLVKGITPSAAFDFHNVKRETAKEVFESGANSD